MTQVMETNSGLLGQVEALQTSDAPAWLTELRRCGREHFESVGLPHTKMEEWQQTNVAPIGKTAWQLPEPGATVDQAALDAFAVPGLDAYSLVFVDGQFDSALSEVGNTPDSVLIGSLAEALSSGGGALQAHLGQHARPDSEPFVALNTAYLDDGAVVRVPDGVKLDRPVHLLFVSRDTDHPTMTHPRVLVIVGDGSEAHVIEHHVALGDKPYFTNAVTEFIVGAKAKASHYFIERDAPTAYNVSTLQIHQDTESDFHSHTVLLGGKLVRNNVNPTLAGEHVHSLLNGLYVPDGDRHMDNHMYVHHTHPNCDSRQYYTGVLRDKASGVFIGRIKVDRPAQKTDAVQSSQNLLLSDDAHAHNRPQLEIFADDVKCTHGSTTGEIDEQSVFYLRSRGVPEHVARGILVYAFANEAIDRMELEPVRQYLARLMIHHLGLGREVESVLE